MNMVLSISQTFQRHKWLCLSWILVSLAIAALGLTVGAYRLGSYWSLAPQLWTPYIFTGRHIPFVMFSAPPWITSPGLFAATIVHWMLSAFVLVTTLAALANRLYTTRRTLILWTNLILVLTFVVGLGYASLSSDTWPFMLLVFLMLWGITIALGNKPSLQRGKVRNWVLRAAIIPAILCAAALCAFSFYFNRDSAIYDQVVKILWAFIFFWALTMLFSYRLSTNRVHVMMGLGLFTVIAVLSFTVGIQQYTTLLGSYWRLNTVFWLPYGDITISASDASFWSFLEGWGVISFVFTLLYWATVTFVLMEVLRLFEGISRVKTGEVISQPPLLYLPAGIPARDLLFLGYTSSNEGTLVVELDDELDTLPFDFDIDEDTKAPLWGGVGEEVDELELPDLQELEEDISASLLDELAEAIDEPEVPSLLEVEEDIMPPLRDELAEAIDEPEVPSLLEVEEDIMPPLRDELAEATDEPEVPDVLEVEEDILPPLRDEVAEAIDEPEVPDLQEVEEDILPPLRDEVAEAIDDLEIVEEKDVYLEITKDSLLEAIEESSVVKLDFVGQSLLPVEIEESVQEPVSLEILQKVLISLRQALETLKSDKDVASLIAGGMVGETLDRDALKKALHMLEEADKDLNVVVLPSDTKHGEIDEAHPDLATEQDAQEISSKEMLQQNIDRIKKESEFVPYDEEQKGSHYGENAVELELFRKALNTIKKAWENLSMVGDSEEVGSDDVDIQPSRFDMSHESKESPDREILRKALDTLKHTQGMLQHNDKPVDLDIAEVTEELLMPEDTRESSGSNLLQEALNDLWDALGEVKTDDELQESDHLKKSMDNLTTALKNLRKEYQPDRLEAVAVTEDVVIEETLEEIKKRLADEYIEDAEERYFYLHTDKFNEWANYIAGLVLTRQGKKRFTVKDIRVILQDQLIPHHYGQSGAQENQLKTDKVEIDSENKSQFPCLQRISRGMYRFLGYKKGIKNKYGEKILRKRLKSGE